MVVVMVVGVFDPSICLSASLKMKLFCETSSIFELDNVKSSNSVRLPQFLKLTTPKTKQLCETSSIFQVGKIKNEAILRNFLQKWNVDCRADGLVPMRFAIFVLHLSLSKVLRLPRKSDARSSAAPVTQNHLPKADDLMLENATPLRKSPP